VHHFHFAIIYFERESGCMFLVWAFTLPAIKLPFGYWTSLRHSQAMNERGYRRVIFNSERRLRRRQRSQEPLTPHPKPIVLRQWHVRSLNS
jgi:hypothetical protein